MRLCFVSTMNGSPWGGSEELWSQAALRLRADGHDVAASVVWWPSPSPRVLELERGGIHLSFRRVPENLPGRIHQELMRIGWLENDHRRWLRRCRPDVVVISQSTNTDGLEWMELCRQLRIPFSTKVSCNSESWWPDDARADRMGAAYRAARQVMCVSRRNLEMLEAQIGERLPNAVVGWSRYSVPHSSPMPWPDDGDIRRIACVARLEPGAKGQDLLVEVLARPAWRARPIQVDLFGSGPSEQALRRLVDIHGVTCIRFMGQVADVRRIWADHHLLVLPSRFEGLPLSLIEAMLCARAAVATEAAGGGYLCRDDETGFVAAAPSAPALADALERAWAARDRWQSMGQAAFALADRTVSKDPVGDFCRSILDAAGRSGER